MRDPDGSIDARWNYWGTKPEINVEEVIIAARRDWLCPMQMRMCKWECAIEKVQTKFDRQTYARIKGEDTT